MGTDLRERVASRLEELGLKPIPTSIAAGLGRDFLSDIVKGRKRSVRGDKLNQLAMALRLTPRELLGSSEEASAAATVPLVGYVGAGDAAHFYSQDQGELDRVEAPEEATSYTTAREIRGRSMGRMLEGWLVFTGERQRGVPDAFIGRICEVGLPDGRVLIKKIARTKMPGVFNLLSETEDPILEEEVEWSAVVTSMRPR